MTPHNLLRLMSPIAQSLMTSNQSDFSGHTTGFIRHTNAEHPFIWVVRENSTHLYSLSTPDGLQRALGSMETNARLSDHNVLLYHYDGQDLHPVFPATVRRMARERQNGRE